MKESNNNHETEYGRKMKDKREIRFRAWLSGTHGDMTISHPRMEYGAQIDYNGYYLVIRGMRDEGSYPTIPIMQFTGHRDGEGRAIYEGDIMQHSTPFNHPLVVNWDDELAGFVFNDGSTSYHISDKSFTIIGNIYEGTKE